MCDECVLNVRRALKDGDPLVLFEQVLAGLIALQDAFKEAQPTPRTERGRHMLFCKIVVETTLDWLTVYARAVGPAYRHVVAEEFGRIDDATIDERLEAMLEMLGMMDHDTPSSD
jgi:hypothetical protein